MIQNLKPYPAYKDSGVEWLGKVPEHWEAAGLRYVTSCLDGRRVPLNAVERGSMQGPYPYWGANKIIDYINDYLFDEPLVLLGEDGAPFFEANKEVAFFVEGKIWVNNHAHVIRCKGRVQPRYLVHVLNLTDYTRFVDGSTRDKLTQQAMGSIPVILPPLPEQTAIVRFLDYMDRRIRRAIRAKQKLIKLLEEYKQALIHQAVTGQIDVRTGQPYPAYKDSGVEWLGQVPAHWEVRRLKRVARLNPSKSELPLALRDGQAAFLPMERVGSDGQFDGSEVRPILDLWNGFTYFRRGDVIVAKITPCFENGKGACLENLPTAFGFGSTEFHVIRPSKAVVSAYLYRVTILSEFRRLGRDEMTGAAGQQRVPVEFIANFPIPIPPIPEQTAIVEYLDAQTAKTESAIAAARREIELLREFRERLIADVVTGKLDVREAAAQLPEEPPEEEAAEDEGIEEVQTAVEDEQRETHDERSDDYEP
ncbi:MAG TPA: restriction endonuclease subunit S [Sedimentisphaerales bacterium]|nr:restriction endonuclease subunit S [Methanothrix sp.]HON93841.1 restriction endonuclease subunit S [Sedimentisphaerales bacterium]